VASRLCSKAKAGQILVCDCTRNVLAGGAYAFSGPYKAALKGKADAQIVYMLVGKAGRAGEGAR
jgi:class 3 adenylate cyclase